MSVASFDVRGVGMSILQCVLIDCILLDQNVKVMQGQCSEHEADGDGGDSVDEFVHGVSLIVCLALLRWHG